MSAATTASEDDSELLLERLEKNADQFASKRAVAWIAPAPQGGNITCSLTYAELQQATDRLASRMLDGAMGLRPGDRAVLVYPPSLDFMVCFLACLKARVVAVPVFPPNPSRRDTLHMFSKIVKGCGATVALTNTEYSHAKKLSKIQSVLTLARAGDKASYPTSGSAAAWPEALSWFTTDSILRQRDPAQRAKKSQRQRQQDSPLPRPRRTDLAFLQYTSGSTSEPKGVMITHGNLAHNLRIIVSELQADPTVVVVSWLPQYHDMGLIGSYLGALYCAGTGYYLSPLAFLQRPMLWIEAVSRHRATHLQAPNFAFKLTARKFQAGDYEGSHDRPRLDLSSLRHVINAAEPIDPQSMDAFERAFGPFGLPQGVVKPTYGLAEHTVFVCSDGTQRLDVDKQALEVDGRVVLAERPVASAAGGAAADPQPVSTMIGCGYPAKQRVDVKIVHAETRCELPEDVIGEIWVNSPSKAAGYYGMEAETRDDFHARLVKSVDDDGNSGANDYLRTGDLGFFHCGELFICGRLKDLVIVGGRNYYPQDMEATAEASSDLVRPGCSAAFTIDTTHEGGEQVALVMELKEIKSEDVCRTIAATIRSSISQEHSLGIYELVFVEPRTIPKTSSGKIARSWCRKAYLNNALKVVYRQSFRTAETTFETEPSMKRAESSQMRQISDEELTSIRSMDKTQLLLDLTTDLSRIADLPVESIDRNANLVSMLDSLTISQFKGLLESKYATKLSDEYLFRETTTPQKLVEVVKLGYAPDDDDVQGGSSAQYHAGGPTGKASGLAGALGCPPGVVCVIL